MTTDRRNVLGKTFPFSPVYECAKLDEEARQGYHDDMLARELDVYFWRCFWLLHLNQVPGDYVEFGSGSTVSSFRLAHKHYRLRPEIPRRLFAFDSFEGLPDPAGVDKGPRGRSRAAWPCPWTSSSSCWPSTGSRATSTRLRPASSRTR